MYVDSRRQVARASADVEAIKAKARERLARYKEIPDLEEYKDDLQERISRGKAILPHIETVATSSV